MLWLYLAILAYFINACVFIIDKYLLATPIPKYHAYAFGVSVLSLSSLLLIPFGVSWHGIGYFLVALASGGSFFIGISFLYKTIKESDVSVAATQAGTMGAIFTYIFSVLILKESLSLTNLFAFALLIGGIFLLGKIQKNVVITALLSGIFFGLSYVFLKLSFNSADFINGIFWTRIGFVGTAFTTLCSKHVREEIKFSYHNASGSSKGLFVFNKFIAGVGFLILYFSIQLGNVSLVNALLGLQFMFTFLLAVVLKNKFPSIKENLDKSVLPFKLVGIAAVLVGLLMLLKG
ncbi:MAG: EamA family transporter [bacterium]|nr:EamA family transporter [bacterium]